VNNINNLILSKLLLLLTLLLF